jgi:hypothetical protein
MIHGDCSSRGCYAMTDEQIGEIYALARESFFGGQRSFQIQAYPFRMTALNMAKHRNSPHMDFWRMLKRGNDHFEVTRLEPKIDVCEKRYVFDAEAKGRFTPAAACPAYTVNQDIVAAVKEKQQRDDQQMAELVSRGTPTVPVLTHTDGGMHPTFLAAFQKPYTDSAGILRSPAVSLPGTIPAHAAPPREAEGTTGSLADQVQVSRTRVATAQPAASGSSGGSLFGGLFSSDGKESSSGGGVLDRMSRMVGLKSAEPATEAPVAVPAKKKAAPQPKQTASAAKAKSEPEIKQSPGAIRPQAKPAEAAPEQKAASNGGLLNGAQPPVPSGQFDDRWGTFR